jgi:hypothetical protein
MMSRKHFSIHLIRVVLVVSILAATGLLGTSTVYADDGDESVGAEGLNDYTNPPLYHAVESAKGFYDHLYDDSCYECSDSFFEQDDDARESHFKRDDYGGKDYKYADDVDICWFQGHSSKLYTPHHALSFIHYEDPDKEDKYLQYWEAEWGDKDLEWMFIHSCKILSDENRGYWARARNGIHLICSAKTTMQDRKDGARVACWLTDDSLFDIAFPVKLSWFYGCDYRQSSAVTLCVIGETHECGDDYIWCEGTVCDDPQRDSTYNVWTYYCF